MAEIVGLVSAAAGFTSLAIQLGSGVDKLRALYRRSKNFKHDLDAIIEDLEYILRFLPNADTCAAGESLELRAIVQHCDKRAQTLVAIIDKLTKRFSGSSDKPGRVSELKALLKSRDVQGEIEDLRQAIASLKADLILARTFIMDTRPQQLMGLLKIESHLSRIRGDSIPTHKKLRPNFNSTSCDRRSCPCSCHIRGNVMRRFWSLEYTPLSMVLQDCDNKACTARRYRIAFKWVLTPWGFPLAVKFGLDMTTVAGRVSISPSLETERVVRYTSLGFRIIWELDTDQINATQAAANFRELYRKDPHMIFHVNPAGRGYIEELVRVPNSFGMRLEDRLELLELLIKEFGIRLGLDNLRLLYRCVAWIGEDPHLDLLESLLHLGLDPGNLPSPHWKLWSRPCSQDWAVYEEVPDPFFVELMSLLITESPDFGGTSPLQHAILTQDNSKVSQLLEPANVIDANFLGQTPLHLAVIREDTTLMLLEAGYDPNVRDHYGCTPLMYAAAMGKTNVAKMLVTYHDRLLSVDDVYHQSFIHFAMTRGYFDLVLDLIIHIKSKYEGLEGVDWLVSKLAKAALWSLNFQKPIRRTSNLFINLLQFIDNVNYSFGGLAGNANNSTLLHHVVDCEEAEALVAHGFTSFEEEDSNGETPIMNRKMHRDPGWLPFCLKNGADLNHQNTAGETVLMGKMRGLGNQRDGIDLYRASESVSFALQNGAHVLAKDHCVCPCAPEGCLATRFLGIQLADYELYHTSALWTFEVLAELHECGRLEDANQLLLSFIRRSVFEEMGLKHICCTRVGCPDKYMWSLEESLVEDSTLERNEAKAKILEEYMASLLGMPYNQLEQVWLRQLKRTHNIYTRNWTREQKWVNTSDIKNWTYDVYAYVDEKNDEFVGPIFHPPFSRPGPMEIPETQLAEHFLGLEARYRESMKVSPKSLQWYKRRAVPLFRLATEFGLTIEDIVGIIWELKSGTGKGTFGLEIYEIEDCIARIRVWSSDYSGNETTS